MRDRHEVDTKPGRNSQQKGPEKIRVPLDMLPDVEDKPVPVEKVSDVSEGNERVVLHELQAGCVKHEQHTQREKQEPLEEMRIPGG